jgi:hypothetical protein
MEGQQIADVIERLIDAKIQQRIDPKHGGAPQLNKILGPRFNEKLKKELADLLDSREKASSG